MERNELIQAQSALALKTPRETSDKNHSYPLVSTPNQNDCTKQEDSKPIMNFKDHPSLQTTESNTSQKNDCSLEPLINELRHQHHPGTDPLGLPRWVIRGMTQEKNH